MRCLYVLFLIASLISCKSKKEVVASQKDEVIVSQVCPEEGLCKFEVLKSKSLLIKEDNFGKSYPEIVEGKAVVLKFEYEKDKDEAYEDGGYREEIFIELDPKSLEVETTNLQDKKLFFARWCFCKGQAGYYRIDKGVLTIKKLTDENYQITLDFDMGKLPQVIEKLNYTFSLQ